MKQIIKHGIFAVCAILISATSNAQTFKKGDNVGSLSVGIGGEYGIPVSLSYERGVYDINNKMAIGVGGLWGYGSTSDHFSDGKYRHSNILLGARAAYHFTGVKNFDFIGGIMLGCNIESGKWKWNSSRHGIYEPDYDDDSEFLGGLYVGARYYFTENFGVHAELGYGISNFNVGVQYKF